MHAVRVTSEIAGRKRPRSRKNVSANLLADPLRRCIVSEDASATLKLIMKKILETLVYRGPTT